jgi:phospholipase D1/2
MAVEEGGQHGIGARQLTAFVGGIDVTNGRYDTARHSLFRTLEFEHSDDMHQPCIPGADIKFGGGSLQTPQPHCSR